MALFLKTLLALSAGGALMALLLLSLRYIFLRRMPAGLYYYLWIIVLLRLILPVPALFVPQTELAPALEILPAAVEKKAAEGQGRDYVRPGTFAYHDGEKAIIEPVPTPQPEETKAPFDFAALPWVKIIFALWLSGALISITSRTASYLRFYGLIRRYAIRPELDDTRCYVRVKGRRKPELIRSDYVRTPMLMGIFSPLLVLPDAEYTQTQLNHIFLHELMHHRRRDLVYKWLCVLILSVHWFNPLVYLVRREIDRACELSCDEQLIKRMDAGQKQSYGDTLISLASAGRLPAGIVATTFNMEKRHLKERLVKIMKFKERKISAVIALVLSLVLLAGCGAVAGPTPTEEAAPAAKPMTLSATVGTDDSAPTSEIEDNAIVVSTVDELLAAIAPGANIRLAMGYYDLTEASDYGQTSEGKYYSWEETYDGYELVISYVDDLSITGSYKETTIATQPRYANVLKFVSCNDIRLDAIVIGHTEKQGFCSGGVVYLDSCENVNIDNCHLYGCGTIGIFAQNCRSVYATKCSIYECSQTAVYALSSYAVVLDGCEVHDCGEGMVQSVFTVESSNGFAVVNSNVYANTALHLIDSRYSQQVSLKGCEVVENVFTDALFWCDGYSVSVEDCHFDLNHYSYFADDGLQPKLPPVDSEGNELTEWDLVNMTRREASYSGPEKAETVPLDEHEDEDGIRHVTVKTVDEFLAAIGSDTVITLDAELFDLSTASDYGAYGNEYYYWIDIYDGPGLVISGVKNLSIVGDGAVIAAIPRYADVLGFVNCQDIRLEGFTAGHTEEPGQCAGGVLDFQNTWGIDIVNCRLYGCGILGIRAEGCSEIKVEETEIYDCSQGAVALYNINGAEFTDCDIHDCYSPEITIHDGRNILFDGHELKGGAYKMKNGAPVEYRYED